MFIVLLNYLADNAQYNNCSIKTDQHETDHLESERITHSTSSRHYESGVERRGGLLLLSAHLSEQWQMVKLRLNPKQSLKTKRDKYYTLPKDLSKDTNKDKKTKVHKHHLFSEIQPRTKQK